MHTDPIGRATRFLARRLVVVAASIVLFPSPAAAQVWSVLAPDGAQPTGRWRHSMVYDPGTNRLMVFGGINGCTLMSDTWVLTRTSPRK